MREQLTVPSELSRLTVLRRIPCPGKPVINIPPIDVHPVVLDVCAEPGPAPRIYNEAGRDRPGWEIYGLDEKNVHLVMGLDVTGAHLPPHVEAVSHVYVLLHVITPCASVPILE
jgi:hypothetical protein